MPLGERLLPEHFRDASYQTFMTGKWHLGHRRRPYLPGSRGFDHFYGHVTGGIGYTKDCKTEQLFRDARLMSIGGGTAEIMKYLIQREVYKERGF